MSLRAVAWFVVLALVAAACDDEATPPGQADPAGAGTAGAPDGGSGGSEPVACDAGRERCAESCVDTSTDRAHCGACDHACAEHEICEAGRCRSCGALGRCGNRCVDRFSDGEHCGECFMECVGGESCIAGSCTCLHGGLCPACTPLDSDAASCGGCGLACGAGELCEAGACVLSCAPPLTACAGACVDLSSDARFCGDCATSCGPGQGCIAGACACGSDRALCDGSCVDTRSHPGHCGGCGVLCPAGTLCSQGACVAECAAGEMACGGGCVDPSSSPIACGGCGKPCPAEASCQAGQCVCPAGRTACGMACVDTMSSFGHCGGCEQSCAPGQTCVAGVCTCAGPPAALTGDVQPIFDASCTSSTCHDAANMSAGLSLTAGSSHAEMVGVLADQCSDGRLLVDPGVPQDSYLTHKLTGLRLCNGDQMPKQASPLAWAQAAAVTGWICAGAPDD